MSVLEKLKKRRHYPVYLDDVEINVRAMTIGELTRVDAIEDDLKTGFVMGCCLCGDDGQPEFTPLPEEQDPVFAKRVMDALTDVSTETLKQISQAIGRIGSIDVEELRKN